MVVLQLQWVPGAYSRVTAGMILQSLCLFIDARNSSLVTRHTSGISSRLGRAIQTLLEMRREMEGPFLVATVILGFLSIFRKSQASSPFEAVNLARLLRCQINVRPPVQMRGGPKAFSKISTRDSDTPSSCELKDEPTFEPLQGNQAFFRVRASRCPFHWRQQKQGPSHIPIADGSLLLSCLLKLGLPLQSKPGNHLSS